MLVLAMAIGGAVDNTVFGGPFQGRRPAEVGYVDFGPAGRFWLDRVVTCVTVYQISSAVQGCPNLKIYICPMENLQVYDH